MSLGQKMLCEVVSVLLHSPKIIFLDEPTIGLDVSVKSNILGLIKRMNKEQGVTVILTTHDVSDIKTLCERILVLDHGSIIFDNHINKMYKLIGNKTKTIKLKLASSIDTQSINLLQNQFSSNIFDLTVPCENQLNIAYDNEKIDINVILTKITSVTKFIDINIDEFDIEQITG
jgi:ABC-2 type transport system ATP-binding protein